MTKICCWFAVGFEHLCRPLLQSNCKGEMRWAMPAVRDVASEYLCSLAAHWPKLNRELFVYVGLKSCHPKVIPLKPLGSVGCGQNLSFWDRDCSHLFLDNTYFIVAYSGMLEIQLKKEKKITKNPKPPNLGLWLNSLTNFLQFPWLFRVFEEVHLEKDGNTGIFHKYFLFIGYVLSIRN